MIEDKRRKETEFSYEELVQMMNHVKQYDITDDKKSFLKNISTYEQKLVLLESKKPYEVLKYLEELDLPNTKLVLNELKSEEIRKILDLFSSEDKKAFYDTYQELGLVNMFIANDKNAYNHIENLDLDRKIELINSSNQETINSTSKIYETVSVEDKKVMIDNITTLDGKTNLENVSAYEEYLNNQETKVEELENSENAQLDKIEELENVEIEDKVEEVSEPLNNEENNEYLNQINDFIKNKLEFYIENNPKFKDLDLTEEDIFNSLDNELKQLVENDFNIFKENQEDEKLCEFKQATIMEEQEFINEIKQNVIEEQQTIESEKVL